MSTRTFDSATETLMQMVRVDPQREGTLKFDYIQVGRLMRGQVKSLFRDIEMNGGRVEYRNEHKNFFETTFTGVRITGPANLLLKISSLLDDENK